ncbi:MAG: hypothetical protein ABW352_22385 [Polyangiales bacterium]
MVAFLYAGYGRRWAGDDGLINLRVVHQLMQGNGFVFNIGERVEAVTSAGWVFVLWAAGELGADLFDAAWVLSLFFSGLGMIAAALAASYTTRARGGVIVPLGLIGYAGIPVAWDYATSALENGLGMFYLGGAFLAATLLTAASRPSRNRALALAAFIGLAPLVRPDYALYGVVLAAGIVLPPWTWRERFQLLAAFSAPGLTYQIFRMGYFACIVPNTALAKEAFASRFDQGWIYFQNTFGSYMLWPPVGLALLATAVRVGLALRDGRRFDALVPTLLLGSGVLHLLYVARVGGDFMHGRMLLPGLFAIFASTAVVRLQRRWSALLALLPVFAIGAWAVHAARDLRPESYQSGILDERRWYADSSGIPNPTRLEHYTNHMFYIGPNWAKGVMAEGCPEGLKSLEPGSHHVCKRIVWPDAAGGLLVDKPDGVTLPLDPKAAPPDVAVVYEMRPIGIIGLLMGTRISVVDLYGLADPLASRVELSDRGRPGHEKIFPVAWFAAKYTLPGSSADERVPVARKALHCGRLKQLRDAVREPLTLSRFFRNIALSIPLHRVRIPVDPQQAVERFCKAG